MYNKGFISQVVSNICCRNGFKSQIGGNYKSFKIEYDNKIEIEFKKVQIDKKHIDIFISDKFVDEPTNENSCIVININKENKEAYIQGISGSSLYNCFANPDFILKNPGSFYLKMTIKMLQKYKEKFNINIITLKDNATISIDKKITYNLSQFKLLTEGVTWYEKYGFKINKENEKIHEASKKILNKLRVKGTNIRKLLKELDNKKVNNDYIKNILNCLDKNKREKLIEIMNLIFNINRSNETNIIYALVIDKLLSNIENNYKDFVRFKPTKFIYYL